MTTNNSSNPMQAKIWVLFDDTNHADAYSYNQITPAETEYVKVMTIEDYLYFHGLLPRRFIDESN
ncbi:MAG: hypothetical protein CMP91_13180 [Gammaproteobacteria bacterium]|nr:hypothetical protein [Gammaproteobacteria bacterium]|tara:strand:- start:9811 stop:10005 length:195 start_codon:yes stop_codon:yes gene_type:complete